jgi:hypothetical protein
VAIFSLFDNRSCVCGDALMSVLLRRSRSSMYLAVIGWMLLGEGVAPQHADNPARALPSRCRP